MDSSILETPSGRIILTYIQSYKNSVKVHSVADPDKAGQILIRSRSNFLKYTVTGTGNQKILIKKQKKCCGSGSAWIRNFCLDPDPELLFRIQLNMKEQISKNVISL